MPYDIVLSPDRNLTAATSFDSDLFAMERL
jgi:hypothetical protein